MAAKDSLTVAVLPAPHLEDQVDAALADCYRFLLELGRRRLARQAARAVQDEARADAGNGRLGDQVEVAI